MRRYFGGLFLALVMAMSPAIALAHDDGASDAGPPKDFRVGEHKGSCPTPFGTFPCQVHVAGQSESVDGPGVPAKGHWFIDITTGGSMGLPDPVKLSGDVVCLTAIGPMPGDAHPHSAWARLKIVDSNTPAAPADFTFLSRVLDNGEGIGDPPDESADFLAPPGTTCPPIPLSTTPIDMGNITVFDGWPG